VDVHEWEESLLKPPRKKEAVWVFHDGSPSECTFKLIILNNKEGRRSEYFKFLVHTAIHGNDRVHLRYDKCGDCGSRLMGLGLGLGLEMGLE